MKALHFTIDGTPIPQGSKVRYGRRIVDDNAKTLKPWRIAIANAVNAGMQERAPLDGPLSLSAVFTLPRPSSVTRRRRLWPTVRPDLDKLTRALLDGLTTGGAWADDALVCRLTVAKAYAGEELARLEPGVEVLITRIGEEAALP